MVGTKVIIPGGGIAGPVLAMLLKAKGYDPVIYERADGPTDMGLSLGLQPNGLRVLGLIPGLLDEIDRCPVDEMISYSILPGEERELMRNKFPRERFDHGIEGVKRPVLLRALIEGAQARGVPVHFGHQLVDFEQHEESVIVKFANGKTDEGSFVIGCDGLHSNTRICLFGEEEASFTGLTQTGGISPIPEIYKSQGLHPAFNIYADGVHMIGIAANHTQVGWAITKREPEAKETWRGMDEARQEEFKEGPFSKLPFGGGELIRTAERIIKYGLYDRPELQSWHKNRVVLIGDAAHPTSPHLGQGANQALEDIYHLVRLLVKHNPTASAPSTATLESVFTELEQLRIPRTSELVKKARKMGDIRVVSGVDACKQRTELVRTMFTPEVARGMMEDFLKHPFEPGKSEI
ncbi:FAD/NAD(P)-binding domain-containing protein [Polyporus arcularius HHB13444]|uniref:FAD/NAD(P)-binding domain-containing protein n=1 Tax=Polyporus arcularius HHB13444 TaxID=1314778 RepID=A0A5C3PIB5_9APHY|nr:FAD/NAD(P)-binding domain-containing protein [Polyporus arcularius HHB13444]